MENNVVKNNSKGYGYNYASLSDIANQGFVIPKMKTGTENGKEYVFYKDGEEWIRGAEIIIPESKGMNKAQLFGSALTYARRYTTLMALQLSCDDDKQIEDIKSDGTKKTGATQDIKSEGNKKPGVAQMCIEIEKMYSTLEISKILEHYQKMSFSELDYGILEKYYRSRNEKQAK